ncbi:MAG: FecR domain-containing protein [Chloroflexi bacterium]|nr:FecR domain-containing protein [Chloroflexota bacterium]
MPVFKRLSKLGVMLVLLTLLLIGVFPASSQDNPVATLDPVQGLVQHLVAGAPNNQWITINRAIPVVEGDSIRTDSAGLAYLTFFEGVETEILPNTVLKVGQFQVDELAVDPTFQITLEVSAGAMHHQVNQVVNAQSHYEVYTPAAAITVRGTNFWNKTNSLSEAAVFSEQGTVEVFGIDLNGQLGPSALIPDKLSLEVTGQGQLGILEPFDSLPSYPALAPLAPMTCGNAVCEAGEETVCAIDCQVFPNCGDRICTAEEGENPVTCAVDCVPAFRGQPDLPGSQQTTLPVVPTEPCRVIATNAFVQIRVGPGFNRGILDYLDANQPFDVLGQAPGNDGSLWWQLLVPNVAQAWVNQVDVTATGDCARVGEADAPPIIFAQPTAAPVATTAPGMTPVPTSATLMISFVADRYTIPQGECAVLSWDVEGIKEVYYQGKGVIGHDQRTECPRSDTTYTLMVVTMDDKTVYRTIDIIVQTTTLF